MKKMIPLDSPEIHNTNELYTMGNNVGLQNRLDIIEGNLNRVCNQHDALMPLLGLLETVPKINSIEQNIKTVQKKSVEFDSKLEKLEAQINISKNQQTFVQIERNFKSTSQSISQIKTDLKDMQQALNNNQKIAEVKIKEDAQNIYRNVDVKIAKNRKDIQNLLAEFKNQISLQLKRNEDIDYAQVQYKTVQNEDVKRCLDGYVDVIHKQYEGDMSNLYREIGMLRSELELLHDKARRAQIYEQISHFPKQINESEKKIAIANLEQHVFFSEIEKFDKENQERILYEIDCLEDKVQQIIHIINNNGKQQTDFDSEIAFLEDRLFSMKNQIHGTKKKYLIDVRKIEDRLEKLIILKEQTISNGLTSHFVQQNIQDIDQYPHRIEQLNHSINLNVEQLQSRQKEIDEKLNALKGLRQ
ncbi:hypothetical protein IMG5_168580 [Ichthyophthirius multifiliis]|uniref:Uncharacterized protein n=1 Tax=Ichthyophthirius multifiliis TaxID=5932 RepID=G0R155_ICHMU|nr:hypothetical protein IMG5_168580 [Ichthyophthirius multifiliis]EGR28822.1 hypothetical protein IMG5_168580 [Ichthyophthirius multifiliis]|eukprot:XP_004030058.1 hypothetical protein IMG5_168580 [Ichthyophthirius multifiliis]